MNGDIYLYRSIEIGLESKRLALKLYKDQSDILELPELLSSKVLALLIDVDP